MSLYTKPCEAYTDEELIEMLRSDDDAIRDRAITCIHRIYVYLVKITAAKTELEEYEALEVYNKAVMELAAYVRQAGFRLQKSLKGLLIGIYKNRCIDALRKNSTNKKKGPPISLEPSPPPDGLVECLSIAFKLAGLPPHCWEMFMQRMIDGISPEELAETYDYKNAHAFAASFYAFKERWKAAMLKVCEQYPSCRMLCPKKKPNLN